MNFKSDTVKTFELSVTPAMAKAMLETSTGNRKIRPWHVEVLADAQRRGEWKITHQGAAFDWNGALRDGHHRLMACVRSGVTIPMLVTAGLDPNAFDAVDQGVSRNLSDLTGWDKRVAEPIRLATIIARSNPRVTTAQVYEIAAGGLADSLKSLIEYCGSSRRYYSSAPMRLAAAATIMNGGNVTFVMEQYRALCTMNFDAMTNCSKALVRQVESTKSKITGNREPLARGLRVFDSNRADISRIQVSDDDVASAIVLIRTLMLESIGEGTKPSARLSDRQNSILSILRKRYGLPPRQNPVNQS